MNDSDDGVFYNGRECPNHRPIVHKWCKWIRPLAQLTWNVWRTLVRYMDGTSMSYNVGITRIPYLDIRMLSWPNVHGGFGRFNGNVWNLDNTHTTSPQVDMTLSVITCFVKDVTIISVAIFPWLLRYKSR